MKKLFSFLCVWLGLTIYANSAFAAPMDGFIINSTTDIVEGSTHGLAGNLSISFDTGTIFQHGDQFNMTMLDAVLTQDIDFNAIVTDPLGDSIVTEGGVQFYTYGTAGTTRTR